MSLKEEILAKRKDMTCDSYPMSIGEVINLYKDGELDVHPEFQRFFRWDEEQKTKLIESILLGIPIPPIFVSQKLDGKWDVIDGQQRLSTILQFVNVLKKDNGEKYQPLILGATKFLPSLDGVTWNNEDKFLPEQKITFKREKLNFTIIKETAESNISKYEMFQRLNTGGTHLSAQEIRNCLMIMINKSLYEKIKLLNNDMNFNECIQVTETQADERYDLELIVRFLLYITFTDEFLLNLNKSRNMDNFLTEELEKYAKNTSDELIDKKAKGFKNIFRLLHKILGENTFKKYQNGVFKGAVMIAAYEAIVPGLYLNFSYWRLHEDKLIKRIQDIYCQDDFISATRRGTRALDRMSKLIKFSREWFKNEN